MDRSSNASFDGFVANSAVLLDSTVMLTHYDAVTLFSDEARAAFVAPNLEAIPVSS